MANDGQAATGGSREAFDDLDPAPQIPMLVTVTSQIAALLCKSYGWLEQGRGHIARMPLILDAYLTI
jgi:hypothetical protein